MTTLRLKTKSTRADTLSNGRQVAVHYKRTIRNPSLTHMDQFASQPVELRLSTGEIMTGRFTMTRYDVLLNCDDGRALCCRLIGSEET